MKSSFIFVLLTIHELVAAPTDGPVRIAFAIPDASGLVNQVHEKVSSISDAAVLGASVANNIVSSNLVAAGENLNSGFADSANAIQEQTHVAGSFLSHNLESAGKLAGDAATAIQHTVAGGSKVLVGGISAIQNTVADGSKVFEKSISSLRDVVAEGSNVFTNGVSAIQHSVSDGTKAFADGSYIVQNAAAERAKTLLDGANIATTQKTNFFNQANSNSKGGIFSAPPLKLEKAILERENFDSKLLTAKEAPSSLLIGLFQPTPIVDSITEEEKYGNAGDRFEPLGRALVSGTQSITKFISNAANIPFDIFKQITRSASESLNNLGGRLIGL